MRIQNVQYTGRKAKVGKICFVDNRLSVFVGYCPDDTCRAKLTMSLDEARDFANTYNTNKKRTSEAFVEKLINARRL
jgi:hypothetical protein